MKKGPQSAIAVLERADLPGSHSIRFHRYGLLYAILASVAPPLSMPRSMSDPATRSWTRAPPGSA